MFNKNKRTENALKSSAVGTVTSVINLLLAFVYRTFFIKILSADYLGLNGLFSSVLTVISLVDLGIASAIVFRLYKPLSEGDVRSVGQLMNYFKRAYRTIALVVFCLGMAIFPFIGHLIKDTSEIPADVNIKVVYLLYLAQSISTYFFAYKQTLPIADQRQYIISLLNTLIKILQYVLSLTVLLVFRKYIATLLVNTIVNVLANYFISLWVTKKYPEVFAVKEQIPDKTRKEILYETRALLCHRVAGTVLVATDNIVITRWVSLLSTGIYSNYVLILTSISTILGQMLGNVVASVGNAYVELDIKQNYLVFKRLLFLNSWIVCGVTALLYLLYNEFISAWIGSAMVFGKYTVVCLCLQFFLEQIRIIQEAYIAACGLYVKDKIRPFIEAGINLSVSILLALKIGVTGVILGTVISHLLTVSWRQPYLLYKYVFTEEKITDYLLILLKFAVFALAFCISVEAIRVFAKLTIESLPAWVIEAIILAAAYNILAIPVFGRSKEFKYYLDYAKNKLKRAG